MGYIGTAEAPAIKKIQIDPLCRSAVGYKDKSMFSVAFPRRTPVSFAQSQPAIRV